MKQVIIAYTYSRADAGMECVEKTGGWMSKIMNKIDQLEVIEGKDRSILGWFSSEGQEVAGALQTEISSTDR